MTARPDKAHPETLGFSTQAIHVGNAIDEGSGAIRTPIIMANSYALPYDPSTVDWSGTDIPLYTRNTGANQIALQQKIAALEGAEDAVVHRADRLPSGRPGVGDQQRVEHRALQRLPQPIHSRLRRMLLPSSDGRESTTLDSKFPHAGHFIQSHSFVR